MTARIDLKLLPPLVVGLCLFAAGVHLSHGASAEQVRPVTTTAAQSAVPAPSPTPSPTPAPKPQTAAPAPAAAPKSAPVPAPAPPPTASQQAVASSGAAPGTPASSLVPAPAPAPSPTPSPTPSPSSSPSGSSSSLAPAAARYSSTNWAGYFMASASYTAISGSWTATSPTGNGSSTTADATWIGIGGASTNDLIQVGTTNIVSAAGRVSAAAFYELIPDAPVYPSAINVSPGDSMSGSITETTPGQWTITITDVTKHQTFTTSVAYTSTHSSAEWIQEDPSYASGGLVPFDNFGTAHFTGSAATAGGTTYNLKTGSANAIMLVDGSTRQPLATPTVLDSDNASFDVVRN